MLTKPSVKITFNSDANTVKVRFRDGNRQLLGYKVYLPLDPGNEKGFESIGYDSVRFVESGGVVMPLGTVLAPPPFNPWSLLPGETDSNTKDNSDVDEDIAAEVVW